MATITTYSVTHKLGRTSRSTADADAIVQRVNAVTAGNGDSVSRDAVQAELDGVLRKMAERTGSSAAEIAELYELEVVAIEVEIEE